MRYWLYIWCFCYSLKFSPFCIVHIIKCNRDSLSSFFFSKLDGKSGGQVLVSSSGCREEPIRILLAGGDGLCCCTEGLSRCSPDYVTVSVLWCLCSDYYNNYYYSGRHCLQWASEDSGLSSTVYSCIIHSLVFQHPSG